MCSTSARSMTRSSWRRASRLKSLTKAPRNHGRCRCSLTIAAKGFFRTRPSFACDCRRCGCAGPGRRARRKATRWDAVLLVLVAYRLLAPGSEWRLHREWFERSALADLLGADFALAEINKLYACHDRLLAHKQALFDHLVARWRE